MELQRRSKKFATIDVLRHFRTYIHEQYFKYTINLIDLEMTGLDTDNDQIIEIATIITDDHLNVLAEGPVLAIHQPDRILNAMDEWNTRQHGQSGLIERVRRSKLTARDAELQTLEFLKNG